MDYNMSNLIPFIPPVEYDKVAEEFLEEYCPEALKYPMAIPIEKIAADMGLTVQYVCLSEDSDIYGATIFTDGALEIYDPEEGLFDTKVFKRKTVLIDPEAVKKTNVGCKHNTLAHECVHWYKHRLYYKMQKYTMPRMARFCKCSVNQLPYATEDDNIMRWNLSRGFSAKHNVSENSVQNICRAVSPQRMRIIGSMVFFYL